MAAMRHEAKVRNEWTGRLGYGGNIVIPRMDTKPLEFREAVMEVAELFEFTDEQLVAQLQYLAWSLEQKQARDKEVKRRKEFNRMEPEG